MSYRSKLMWPWQWLASRVSRYMDTKAALYYQQGNYAAALPLRQRALAIREQALGPQHADVAGSLNNLAMLYYAQGNYAAALPLQQRALAIREQVLGPQHPHVAGSLNNLAMLYDAQGNYAAALPLYQRALAIQEQALGPQHTDVAGSLNNLALLYSEQGDYAAALPLQQRALAIQEQVLGPQHADVAGSLNNLATLYQAQGNYAAALPLYQRALAIREQVLGPQHADVAGSLNNLALLYSAQGNYTAALPLQQRALAIQEQVLGPQHPDVADSLNNLALLYREQGNYAAALPLYQRALAIQEQALGPQHKDVAASLNHLAVLYHEQGNYPAALPLQQRALAIQEQVLGPQHPYVAGSLNGLAVLYREQGDYAKALPLQQRALAIYQTLSHQQIFPQDYVNAHHWAEQAWTATRAKSEVIAQQQSMEHAKEMADRNQQLSDTNARLQQAQQNNATLLTRYSHTLADTLFPDVLYTVAASFKKDPALKKAALILQHAYQAETDIILENELLRIRHSTTTAEQFRQAVRADRRSVTDQHTHNIVDILNYALSRMLARILNQDYARMQNVRAAILNPHGPTLDSLQQDFEATILLSEPPQQAWQWCHNHLRPLELHHLNPLWQDIRLRKASLATAVLYGHFMELLYNAFKYADHQASWFLRISFASCLVNEVPYLTMRWENPRRQPAHQGLGTGCGLESIKNDLCQLNDTTDPYTTLWQGSTATTFKLCLHYQADLLQLPAKRHLASTILQAKRQSAPYLEAR